MADTCKRAHTLRTVHTYARSPRKGERATLLQGKKAHFASTHSGLVNALFLGRGLRVFLSKCIPLKS